MDLASLQVFLMVARERSFSRAAERLYRTQPAVSIAVRKLEDWVGQPLLVRGTGAGKLTEAGELLVEYAERMLNLRSEARRSIEDLAGLRRGRLSLGVNESSIHALLPALARFRRKWPKGAGAASALGGGVPTGNAATVLNEAKKYVGVPYVWGAIPGKGQDPRSSGWDCSGFTYWLDQNYGTGQLPEGSHYQYQYAQQTGKLFTDTSQLQPGDLLFFNTGADNGGGAELNSAGHVAIYLGNGQIIQAANPSEGTVISDFSGYYAQTYIGAMHMSWSGGTPGGIGSSIGGALTSGASGATSSAWTPYASWGSDRRMSSNPYASWGR